MNRNLQEKLLFQFLKSMAPISQELFDEIIPLFVSESYNAGDYLVRQGDEVFDIFFIINGLVRSFYLTKDGVERNKCFYGENSVVSPHYSLSIGSRSNLNIVCIEKTIVLKVNFKKIRQLNDEHLGLQICARKIAEKEFVSKDKRELQFLTMDSKDRYIEFTKDYAHLLSRIPDNQIASYLGIRKETLSRLKKP